jgi:hypothetical protein
MTHILTYWSWTHVTPDILHMEVAWISSSRKAHNTLISGFGVSFQYKYGGIHEEEEPTRCYLVFYYTYDRLNMFRAPLCPSSGAHDYTADYHMGRLILRLLMVGGLVQVGWLSFRVSDRTLDQPTCTNQPAPANLHQTSNHHQPKNQKAHVLISGIIVSSWWWA